MHKILLSHISSPYLMIPYLVFKLCCIYHSLLCVAGGMDHQKYQVTTGNPSSKYYCKKAKGEIVISYGVTTLLLPDIVTGNVLPLKMKAGHSLLNVGLGWKVTQRQTPIDLDVSIVAIDAQGEVDIKESVYFANLSNPNGSITHSGDEREGMTSVAGSDTDDRERITINLDKLPDYIAAYVLVVTVATPGVTFDQITSARVRICDGHTGMGFCAFRPAYEGAATAMFCLRIARTLRGKGKFSKDWSMATIGETDHCARDFGKF